MKRAIVAGLVVLGATAADATAPRRAREHGHLFRGMESGELVAFAEIERRLLPGMRGYRYLGPEYDARARRYRLKFIRNGNLIWLDVDARTGRVIDRISP